MKSTFNYEEYERSLLESRDIKDEDMLLKIQSDSHIFGHKSSSLWFFITLIIVLNGFLAVFLSIH